MAELPSFNMVVFGSTKLKTGRKWRAVRKGTVMTVIDCSHASAFNITFGLFIFEYHTYDDTL